MRAVFTRSFMRLKQRRIVLFPQPDGPISAVILLVGTAISTPSTASFLP